MAKKKDPFKRLGNLALGMGGAGLALGVSGGIVGRAAQQAPQVAPLSEGISTAASFAPIMGTAIGGKIALDTVKGLKKKRRG